MHVRCEECGRVVPTTRDGRLYTHPFGRGVCPRSGKAANASERRALVEETTEAPDPAEPTAVTPKVAVEV